MQTTTIRFEKHGVQLLVDRVERAAFLMDYENAEHLGVFDVCGSVLLWHGLLSCPGFDDVPRDIVDTVRSMICHQGART